MILSSRRALQISGTLVAGLEKSTSLRCLQVPFSILHSLAVSLWPILSSSMIISCSLLNHFHSESYCGSSAQVLFSLILVKNGNMQSKMGSKSSLYSFMHNNFLVFCKNIVLGGRMQSKNHLLCASKGLLQQVYCRVWWMEWVLFLSFSAMTSLLHSPFSVRGIQQESWCCENLEQEKVSHASEHSN